MAQSRTLPEVLTQFLQDVHACGFPPLMDDKLAIDTETALKGVISSNLHYLSDLMQRAKAQDESKASPSGIPQNVFPGPTPQLSAGQVPDYGRAPGVNGFQPGPHAGQISAESAGGGEYNPNMKFAGRDNEQSSGGGEYNPNMKFAGRDNEQSPGGGEYNPNMKFAGRDNEQSPGGGEYNPQLKYAGQASAESAGGGEYNPHLKYAGQASAESAGGGEYNPHLKYAGRDSKQSAGGGVYDPNLRYAGMDNRESAGGGEYNPQLKFAGRNSQESQSVVHAPHSKFPGRNSQESGDVWGSQFSQQPAPKRGKNRDHNPPSRGVPFGTADNNNDAPVSRRTGKKRIAGRVENNDIFGGYSRQAPTGQTPQGSSPSTGQAPSARYGRRANDLAPPIGRTPPVGLQFSNQVRDNTASNRVIYNRGKQRAQTSDIFFRG